MGKIPWRALPPSRWCHKRGQAARAVAGTRVIERHNIVAACGRALWVEHRAEAQAWFM